MKKIAFLGLGVMGAPMAGHLARIGHQVTVYNRTTEKAEAWAKANEGTFAITPFEAASEADIVFSCVGNDEDLREVSMGKEGAFHNMKEGSVFVDHTTTSAKIARELYQEAQNRGIGFLDAPISGGQAGAENGVLSIMCGGDQETFDHAKPVMEAYGRTIALIGETGSGQLCKMVNQICIAGLLQGLSEGLAFSQKSGLDGEKVLEVITGGAAGSWQMSNRGHTMLKDEFDFGFAVDWMCKDLGIVIEEGQRIDADLEITQQVNAFYQEIKKSGGGRKDTSSLITRLSRKA